MPTSFCSLEEAWGEDYEDKTPIERVDSLIEPVSAEKNYKDLTPHITRNKTFENEDDQLVQQCDICNLVLEQLKSCPDCLNKFRQLILVNHKDNSENTENERHHREILKKPSKNIEEDFYDSGSDIDGEEADSENSSKNNNKLSTDRIIIYVLIGLIILLLVFELFMSFNRRPPTIPQYAPPIFYGGSSNLLHL